MKKRNKSKIINKVLFMAAVSIVIVTAVFLVTYGKYKKEYQDSLKHSGYGEIIVALNEIDNLIKSSEDEILNTESAVTALISDLQTKEKQETDVTLTFLPVFYLIAVVSILLIYTMIYILVLKPFQKLENFAAEIASGNLDSKLPYERVNMFGEFTWAFDHMRLEILKARQCEQEAVENNKTVIATLSHDIKTPIASIRAYCEALSGNMDSTPERRNRYIGVIMKKCDEVKKITDDMFIHSLHNLDKLIIKKEEVKIHEVIKETVASMEGNRADIQLGDIKEGILKRADNARIAQVLENLINNARKYAPGKIYITTEIQAHGGSNSKNADMNAKDATYIIHFRDYGKGIPPEDMPFIFDKFYRGKNHGNEPGAGLGLFIVKYVMQQMDGDVTAGNHKDGLEMILTFPMDVNS